MFGDTIVQILFVTVVFIVSAGIIMEIRHGRKMRVSDRFVVRK